MDGWTVGCMVDDNWLVGWQVWLLLLVGCMDGNGWLVVVEWIVGRLGMVGRLGGYCWLAV